MLSPLKLILLHLETYSIDKFVPLQTVINLFKGQGSYCLFFLLSAPFCFPVPLPGLSTPLGFLIAFVAFRKLFNKKPYLPKKFRNYSIKGSSLKKICRLSLKFEKILSKFSKQRIRIFNNHKMIKLLIIIISGLLLSLPIPIPFTNMPFAWTIALISIAHLMNDGLLTLAGYSIFFLVVVFYINLFF